MVSAFVFSGPVFPKQIVSWPSAVSHLRPRHPNHRKLSPCVSPALPFRRPRALPLSPPSTAHLRRSIGAPMRLASFSLELRACLAPAKSGSPSPSREPRVSPFGLAVAVVWFALSLVVIVPMLLVHPVVLALDRYRRRFQIFCCLWWMRLCMLSVALRPQVVGREKLPRGDEAVVYVANHASYLDIFAVAFLMRALKYVSKSEIFRIPIIGVAMRLAGHVGVERMNRRGQMEAFRRMISELRSGSSLVVYPEGTRSESGAMRKFQNGAFRAAKSAGVRVVPLTIGGTRDVMPAKSVVPIRRRRIRITVHDPIDVEEIEVEEISEKAYKAIASAL